MEKELRIIKSFSYKSKHSSLEFNLTKDNFSEFKTLLTEAIKDVDIFAEEIEKLN